MLRPDSHSFRPDIQIHAGAAWTALDQTSNIRTGSLRPDIQAEAEHFQTRSPGSDRSCLDGFSLEKISEDISVSGRTSSQQASKLRPDSLEPSIPDGPDTPPWTKQSPDMPPQTRSYQTKHPSSDWTASSSGSTTKDGISKRRPDSHSLRLDIQAQTRQIQTRHTISKQNHVRVDVQAQTGEAQLQTKRFNSDRTSQFRQRRLTSDSEA